MLCNHWSVAGPYGLSAAHLKTKGIAVCVLANHGVLGTQDAGGDAPALPRVASNLSDPGGAFTLEAYRAASKRSLARRVPLDTFVEYGGWFRHQLGSDLDEKNRSQCRSGPAGLQTCPCRTAKEFTRSSW